MLVGTAAVVGAGSAVCKVAARLLVCKAGEGHAIGRFPDCGDSCGTEQAERLVSRAVGRGSGEFESRRPDQWNQAVRPLFGVAFLLSLAPGSH